MDKLFINVPTTDAAENYKTTYVTGTQGHPRDDSRDNQIAFLKATQEIVTRGTVFGGGGKPSVDPEYHSIVIGSTTYNLVLTDAGTLALKPYTPASAAGGTGNNSVVSYGSSSYLYGTQYNIYAKVNANNKISYSLTTNGNNCAILGAKYGSTYVFGQQAYLDSESGLTYYLNGQTHVDPDYSTSSVSSSYTVTTAATGAASDGTAYTESGTMGTSKVTTTASTIAERSWTIYWHEQGKSSISTVTYTMNVASTSQYAKPICYLYYSTGEISKAANGTLTSTTSINKVEIKQDNIASYSGSIVLPEQTFASTKPSIAWPKSWGTPSIRSAVGPDTGWVPTEENVRLSTSATSYLDYTIYTHIDASAGAFIYTITW